MKLHNTLTGKKETFSPLNPPKVTVYTCGPTVYETPQIGNWLGFVFYDTLTRTLRAGDYEVEQVLNITDVGHLVGDEDEGEDKLQKSARAKRLSAWEVAEKYAQEFYTGLDELNIQRATHMPKATDYIKEQIKLIERLESLGYTYKLKDGVYFDTAKLADYGKLAGLKGVEQLAGARVEVNQDKRQPTDFALWKLSGAGQQRDMEWDSPWGVGFPGWHIECSCMALELLSETIDIHAGGIDHINVHHTNEIAQSEAATGKPFANYWLHNEHLLVDGRKMSKSLGNVYTLEDIKKRGFTPLDFRLRLLQSHYRSQLNFTWESLESARNLHDELKAWADLGTQEFRSQKLESYYRENLPKLLGSLQDDLNTPAALSTLSGLVKKTQELGIDSLAIKAATEETDRLLGLKLGQREDISDEFKALISRRQAARDAADFKTADELRQQLAEHGIGLRDTPQGIAWFRSDRS